MDSQGDKGFPTNTASASGEPQSGNGRHLAYFAHAPLAVMVVDASGRYLEVNPAACRLTGYEEAELLAMSVADVVAEESRAAGREHFARVKDAGHASGEFALIRKDGSRRWATCDAVKLSEDRFIAFKLDTTDRRNAEEALRRSQSELRAIYDHSPVMMCVIDADRQVLYCNRAVSSFVGKPEEDVKGDRACGILGCVNALDDLRGCGYGSNCASCSLRAAVLDTFQTGACHTGIDYRATVEHAGNRRNVAFLASTSLIQHDGQANLLLCLEDITERVRAEEAIRESELRFRTLAEKSPAGIYMTDVEGKCLYVNPRWCAMAGLTLEEAIGDGWMQGLHPEDLASIRANWYRMTASGGNWGLEYRFQTRDGRTTWVWGTAAPLRDENGTTHGYIGTNLDITERKQAEERVRLLAELLDASPTSTTVYDAQGNFLYANEKTFSLHGFTREEFFRLNLRQLDVPESERLIEPRLQEIAKKGAASFEVQHCRKDGTAISLRVDAKFARWGDKDVFLSVASDVSDLKRTEQALREREGRLRGILDAASESVFLIDREGIVLECNETTARRLGRTLDDLLGRSIYSLLPSDLAHTRRARVQKVLESGRPAQFEDRRAGVWFEHTVYPVFDSGGQIVEFAIFSRDISERKRNQEQLLLQSLVLNQIQDRVTVTDLQGVITYVNEAECLSMKRSRESLIGQSVLAYGDDPRRGATQLDIIRTTLADGEWRGEVVNYASDGSEIILDCRTTLVKDRDGQPVAMCGIGADITDRKQAEESLRQSEEHYRTLFTSMTQGAFCQQSDGRIVDANPAALRMFGLSRDELLSKTSFDSDWDVVCDDGTSLPGSQHPSMLALRTGKPVHNFVAGILNPRTQNRIWLEISATPEFRAGEDKPCQVLVTLHDITEKRRAVESLRESEERLRLATKATNDVIWDWDVVHDSQGWNEAGTAVFGWSDIVACPQPAAWWIERVHPEDRQRVHEGFHAVYASQDRCNWQDEYRFLKADGNYAFVLDRGYVMRDEEGKAVRMIGAMLDLTSRKRAEESLRQSEEHYRVLAETMLQGVVHQDKDGTIISMNPAAERILGRSHDRFLGSSSVGEETYTIREDGSPFPGLEHPAMVAFRTGQQVKGVVVGVFNPRVNAHRWINVDAVPLFRPGEDHPYQVYTVFEDITDRRQAEQEKLEMERRLLHAQKLESLGILAGGIAHDFNNILAGIMGYADLLDVRLPPSEPAREDVNVIKKAVRRAADLTRQMLAYSGKGKFVVEPVDLSRIVADTRKMLEVSVSKKATLTYNLASDLPAIEADPAQIHQVVLNLVINASEALGENSGVIAIKTYTVQLSETAWSAVRTGEGAGVGRYVCLEVVDTGCGMDRKTLGKIFDPFFTTKFTGRGLGLAALHGIVRGHKGGLRVASEPGEGTIFQVYFPASTVAASPSAVEAVATSWRGSGTVLVVDDEEIVRNTAKRMIEYAGFSVLTACDGEESIRVYRQHQSEVVCVILDLTMPKMNGEEALRELRKITPNICAVLSSGFSEDNATERFSNLGLAGFIQKPYQLDRMVNTLRRALAGS